MDRDEMRAAVQELADSPWLFSEEKAALTALLVREQALTEAAALAVKAGTGCCDGDCCDAAMELQASVDRLRALLPASPHAGGTLGLPSAPPDTQGDAAAIERLLAPGPHVADAIRDAIAHLDLSPVTRALVLDNVSSAVRYLTRSMLRPIPRNSDTQGGAPGKVGG